MTYKDALTLIDAIRQHGYKPNPWEESFITSIETMRPRDLSYKQAKALEKIYAKSAGGGIYQQRQRIK